MAAKVAHLEQLVHDLLGRVVAQEEKGRDLEGVVEQLNDTSTQRVSGEARIPALEARITQLEDTTIPDLEEEFTGQINAIKGAHHKQARSY